jgi:Uma2 family endonuclease
MSTISKVDQQLGEDFLVLNLQNVAFSDEQFIELCADNRDLTFELTARKELVILTPPLPRTGLRNMVISADLALWARLDGTGLAFAPTTFALPNGAKRAPAAAWIRRERWEAIPEEEREKLPVLCLDFVVELMSQSDRRPFRFRMLQAKMEEYIANGTQLGWMIDPFKKRVYIYRPGQTVECLENPTTVQGDPVLPGFVFHIDEVWKQ